MRAKLSTNLHDAGRNPDTPSPLPLAPLELKRSDLDQAGCGPAAHWKVAKVSGAVKTVGKSAHVFGGCFPTQRKNASQTALKRDEKLEVYLRLNIAPTRGLTADRNSEKPPRGQGGRTENRTAGEPQIHRVRSSGCRATPSRNAACCQGLRCW